MPRVAEAECATCHHIRPKTEMRMVTVRRKSTSSYRTSIGLSKNRGHSVGTRDTYRHDRVFVCADCRAPRSDGGFGFFFPAVIAASVVGYLAYPAAVGTRAVDAVASSSLSPLTDETTEGQIDQVVTSQEPEPAYAAESSGQKAEASQSPPDESGSLQGQSNARSNFNFNLVEIADAERRSLEVEEPVRWSVAGLSGYSIASTATVANGIACRNVYSVEDASSATSPTKRYCRAEDSSWVAATQI